MWGEHAWEISVLELGFQGSGREEVAGTPWAKREGEKRHRDSPGKTWPLVQGLREARVRP